MEVYSSEYTALNSDGNASFVIELNASEDENDDVVEIPKVKRPIEEQLFYFAKYFQNAKEEFQKKLNNPSLETTGLPEFDVLNTVGTGSFGRVCLARHKKNGKYYAMKILNKAKIVKLKQVEHTLTEKKLLETLSFPFIVQMLYHFKDNANLYMVLEFINGGELFTLLRRECKFEESAARFYSSQVILAIEYLHSMEIAYRDLKPENLLLDKRGYLKLTDFGFAKIVQGRTWTLCGTPEYLAPEIILSKGYSRAVDWWAVGILLFEMIAGFPPFYADQPLQVYEKIVAAKLRFPFFMSQNARKLIGNLLQYDTTKRFGNMRNGVADIQTDIWFSEIDWIDIVEKKLVAPFIPSVIDDCDISNFDDYPDEVIIKSFEVQHENEFQDF